MYDVGDTYPATIDVVDADGNPVDPTSVTFTFTLPDGTTTTPTPASPTVGRYTHDLPITQYGLHRFRAVSTGPTTAHSDVFSAVDAAWPAFVGLTEVKDHLNIPATTTTHDEELRGFILSASEVVESITGPVGRRTIVETHSGGGGAIVLRQRPILAITSVLEGGVAVDAADFVLSDAGVLYRSTNYVGGYWACGVNNITVTYEAGRRAAPWSVLDGTKELIRINWRPQSGGNYSVFDQGRGDDFGQAAGPGEIRLGFFIPNTVMQRLQPAARGPLVG